MRFLILLSRGLSPLLGTFVSLGTVRSVAAVTHCLGRGAFVSVSFPLGEVLVPQAT